MTFLGILAGEQSFLSDRQPIDRNRLLVPAIAVEDAEPATVAADLELVIDNLWRAGGFAGDPRTRKKHLKPKKSGDGTT